jgi:CBS domain containing-hemolysin-like protein
VRVARPLDWFNSSMRPFIAVLNLASNSLLRLLRIDPEAQFEEGQSPSELRFLIAQAQTGGHLDAGEAGMLQGVFHLHEQEARQVMTPIPAVVTVDISEDVETALRRCISSGHTRLLVTEDENQDRVKGTVHSNSLARKLMTEGPTASIEDLIKDALIVPETKPLDDLLADLQRHRSSMAVVIDEYGRVAGIVTVEDIIEEVVGEIDDETDPAGGEIRRLANGDWFVRGHVAITDLLDYGLTLPIDTDAYNSVGGFVFAELGRLPRRGDTVNANGYSIRVESVRENRIEAVRIRDRRETTTTATDS